MKLLTIFSVAFVLLTQNSPVVASEREELSRKIADVKSELQRLKRIQQLESELSRLEEKMSHIRNTQSARPSGKIINTTKKEINNEEFNTPNSSSISRPTKWSGPFIGLQGVVVRSHPHYYEIQNDIHANPVASGNQINFIAGWNSVFNPILYGVEIGASYGHLSSRSIGWGPSNFTTDRNFEFRGKIGLPFESVMFYVATGLSLSPWTIDNLRSNYGRNSHVMSGWNAGVGVEYSFNSNWYGRAEITRTEWQARRFFIPGNDGIGDDSYPAKLTPRSTSLRYGIIYRFE